MWDMFCAEEMYALSVAKDSTALREKKNLQLYQQVFASHNITREQFYSNYNYYQQHPDQFKVLLDSVQAYGSRIKEAPNTNKNLPARKKEIRVPGKLEQ